MWLDLATDSPYSLTNLPLGVFSDERSPRRRLGTLVGTEAGEFVLDLAAVAEAVDSEDTSLSGLVSAPTLNPLLAAGPARWNELRGRITDWLSADRFEAAVRPQLAPVRSTRQHLPFEVADYVDFYSSEQHATNVGRLFRPGQEPLTSNWKQLPIGYHGRAGTVVVSGTPITRPQGLRALPGSGGRVEYGPTLRLDIEAELGFVVGVGSTLGQPVPVEAFADHVFGACLVNDWSARDIQAFEYVPLGPFLGKSFATSISPWVVPLEALEAARLPMHAQDPRPASYLSGTPSAGFDITLEIRINGQLVSQPPYAAVYWTPAQLLAHLTANGASLRTGDLYASGTISGDERDQRGSLLELSWGGSEPLRLPDGTERSFLLDGDVVSISATAPGAGGSIIGFGEVSGQIRNEP